MTGRERHGLEGARVLVVISGAASAALIPAWLEWAATHHGCSFRSVLTRSAERFVTPAALSTDGEPALTEASAPAHWPAHVELNAWADRVLVAPATANFIAKVALGLMDDIASTVAGNASAPRLLCPALAGDVADLPAVARNLSTAKADGWHIAGPGTGRSRASGASAPGAMVDGPTAFAALADSVSAVARV